MNEKIGHYFQISLEELEDEMLSNFNPRDTLKYMGDVGGDGPNTNKGILEKIVSAVVNNLNSSPQKFRQMICMDLKYCERRNTAEIDIAVGVADTALCGSFALLFPPMTLAVYLIRRQVLDRFCRCQ